MHIFVCICINVCIHIFLYTGDKASELTVAIAANLAVNLLGIPVRMCICRYICIYMNMEICTHI